MADTSATLAQMLGLLKRMGKDLLGFGHIRAELFAVEVQEERERLITAFLLSLTMGAFALLAGFSFTIAVAVLLWQHSPGIVLLLMAAAYALLAYLYYRRLLRLRHEWSVLSETIHQLQKDRECIEKWLD